MIDNDWFTLSFSPNSVRHSTVALGPGGRGIYNITTDIRSNSKTQVVDAQTKALVAYLERNDILPDTIKFVRKNGGKKARVSKWLVSGKTADKFPITFMNTNLGRSVWKSDPSNRLALFGPDDLQYASPLAYIRPDSAQLSLLLHKKLFNGESLDLNDEQAWATLEDLLLAVIYLEGRMRSGDKPASVSAGVAQEAFISTAMGN